MKVLLVNSYDNGGAAKACIRLHKALLNQNVESKLLFKNKQKYLPFSEEFKTIPTQKIKAFRIKIKIRRILSELKLLKVKPPKKNIFSQRRDKRLDLFSYPNTTFDITTAKLYKEADIINLHWVADFLDFETFFKKNTKPVIWTLHDMNPFSGGEHYTEKYLGIDSKGLPIERVVTELEKKIFLKNIELKIEALAGVSNINIVVLCNWMYQEVKKSRVFKKYPITLIPNGIDTTIFKPVDKIFSRNLLNIPLDKKVVLFVSDNLNNNRKGFVFLKKAMDQLNSNDLLLCSVGKSDSEFVKNNNVLDLGAIYDERLMSLVYNAADVFIIPSLMDNLPNTVVESLLCGTPVIGFPVGGISDLIINGENGLLTEDISVKSLLNSIKQFFKEEINFNREKISKNASHKYKQSDQAKAYVNLYTNILKQ